MNNTNDLEHFVTLAMRGAHPGASGGEKRCNMIAKAFHKIGNEMMGIDADAVNGACELLKLMTGPFPTDKDIELVYGLVRKAATGKR